MKLQHLVPVFILALTLPGYASAGSGAAQKGGCGCGTAQKHVSKSGGSSCGCHTAHHGKGHGVVQKGSGHLQKSHGISQKSHGIAQKSHGGCSTCCLDVIPAVLNGVDHIVTSTVEHVLTTVFACGSCGTSGKSKSKGCDCHGSPKNGLPGVPPNPFEDDDLQPPPVPSTEALHRIERRPVHRQVTRTNYVAPVVNAEPRALTISTAEPLTRAKPKAAPVVRTVSAESQATRAPYNPLRAK